MLIFECRRYVHPDGVTETTLTLPERPLDHEGETRLFSVRAPTFEEAIVLQDEILYGTDEET